MCRQETNFHTYYFSMDNKQSYLIQNRADRHRKIKTTPCAKTPSDRTDTEGNILPATCSSTVWVAMASLSLTLTVYDAVSSVLRSDNRIPASPTCNNMMHSASPAWAHLYDVAIVFYYVPACVFLTRKGTGWVCLCACMRACACVPACVF